MTALVTGGAGFVGSHVADALTAAGHQVRVFDVTPSPFLQPGQTMLTGDILDAAAVHDAVRGCDAVFHFAGYSDLDAARSEPMESARLNVLGTINLLDAARAAGVTRFVHASTVYVYSERGGFYRCSKQAAELYVEEFQRRYGLAFTIARYGTLYGPRADARNSVYRLLHQALTDRRIQCDGTGQEVRDYVNVRDAARLSVELLAPSYENQHIIITGPASMEYRRLVEMIAEIVGEGVDVTFDGSGRQSHYKLTPVAFAPKIGYKLTSPLSVDMAQGLLECLHEIHASLRR
jgi:UDP-glucose 4-epimerase